MLGALTRLAPKSTRCPLSQAGPGSPQAQQYNWPTVL